MKKRATFLALTAVLALTWSACGDDETETTPPLQMTAASYNLGLAVGFVKAAEERASLTIAQTAALAADVVCVQEVWLPKHVDDLKAATAASYPNSVFMQPDVGTTGPAACTDAGVEPLLTCVAANGCDQICADDLVDCVLDKCITEFSMLTPECNGCLQANVGQPLPDIEATCKSETTEFAFGGSFGIGLLSKFPIVAQETTVLDSTTNRRGVIYAELDTPLGTVHAFCTHLTAVFTDIEYPKATGSWEEEQAAQIAELITLANAKAGADGQLVIMGDMNAGPAGPGYIAEAKANYDLFTAAGFASPYVDTAGHTCTFCGDNPLIDGGDDVVIDHIFVRDLPGTASGSRIVDGTVEVSSCGVPFTGAYSDHYGISVTIER